MTSRLTLIAIAISLSTVLSAQTKTSNIFSSFSPNAAKAQDNKAIKRGLIENDMPKQIISYNDKLKMDTANIEDYTYLSDGKISTLTTTYFTSPGQFLQEKETYSYKVIGTDTLVVVSTASTSPGGNTLNPSKIDSTITSYIGYEIYSSSYEYSGGKYIISYANKSNVELYPNNKFKSIEDLSYNYDSMRLLRNQKTEFTLDGNGEYNEALIYQWDEVSMNYVEESKVTNFKLHNGIFGEPEKATISVKVAGVYVESYKFNSTYTPEGWLATYTAERNDGSSFKIVNYNEYKYDTYGNTALDISVYDANGDQVLDTVRRETTYTYDSKTRVTNSQSTQTILGNIDFNQKDYFYGTVGIVSPAKTASLSVYPNPAAETVNINFGNAKGMATIKFYDVSGREVNTQQTHLQAGQTLQLNVANLPSGAYIIKTVVDGQSFSGRIMKK